MREEDAYHFATYAGRRTYTFDVPVDLRDLRIDPVAEPAVVEVRRIALQTHGFSIRLWGDANDFRGWQPANELINFKTAGSAS